MTKAEVDKLDIFNNEKKVKMLKALQIQTKNSYIELTKVIKNQMNDAQRVKVSNLVINRIHVRD